MKIAISGATGLVGTELKAFLRSGGHEVRALVRDPARRAPGDVLWDPARDAVEAEGLEGLDAVVHLAGANVAVGRWNAAQKERIRGSRVAGTRLLARTLAGLRRAPTVLIAASAVGIYGDRGDEVLTEGCAPGRGFLAEVAEAWEAAAEPAAAAGIRTVHLRIGVVLSPRGGALRRMLMPFRLGLGGRLGDGRQWFPWIAIDDVVGVVLHALTNDALRGPVNTVAPDPVRNEELTRTLARVLRRPAILPVPRFALRLLLGEMADGLLLASMRAVPDALRRSGYTFRHPRLEGALRHLLGR